jgi:hypothetical protein
MDLTRSMFLYAAASGIFTVVILVFAALALLARLWRRRAARNGGDFAWVESELQQIAAQRSPEPQADTAFDDGIAQAEMVIEARRIIAEVSQQRRSGSRVNIDEALAHGLGVTRSNGLKRRLSSQLARLQAGDRRFESASRIKLLRHLVEADERPGRHQKSTPQHV